MGYSDGGYNARMILHTIQHSVDFSSRARRTEVLYYLIATALFGVVINFVVSTILPFYTGLLVSEILRLPFLIPTFALFARRVHDQNRSSWWMLIYAGSVLLGFIQLVQFLWEKPDHIMQTNPISIIAIPVSIVVLGLMLWPGTDGPNKYGDDPRTSGS